MIDPTTTESKLLLCLFERGDRVINRGQLLENVWYYREMGVTRTVDTHVPLAVITRIGAFGTSIQAIQCDLFNNMGVTYSKHTILLYGTNTALLRIV